MQLFEIFSHQHDQIPVLMWDCAVFLLLVPHLQIVSHSLTTSAGHALFHCLVFTPWIQREGFYYIHKIYLVFVGVLLKNVFQFCVGGLIQSEVRQYMGIFGLENSQNCQIWLKKVCQFMDTYSPK